MSWLIITKITLVFALVWLALLAMRPATAALRHLVVVVALSAALLMPALEVVLPAWQVLPTTAIPVASDSVEQPRATVPIAANEVMHAASSTASVRRATAPRDWGRWLFGLWLSVAGLLLTLLVARLITMELAARRAGPCTDARLHAALHRVGRALDIDKPVQLRLREPGAMPAVWGLRKPLILLPADCLSWPETRRRDVLAHELAHIARRDVAVSMLGHVACALHWFNPLAWVLKSRLAIEAEHACDDMALAHGAPASRYADHLLATAVACRKHYSVAPVMAARSQLEGRIMAILDTNRNRNGTSLRVQFAVAAVAAAAIVPLSSLAFAQASTMLASATQQYSHSQSDSSDFAAHLDRLGIDQTDIDALLAGLNNADALTRGASAWALGDSDDERVIDPLIQAGYDTDARVRQWAMRSLSAWKAPRIAPMLIDRLQDDNAEVRQWATRTLAGHDTTVSTQPLIDTLDDDNAEVREWAVRVLADADDAGVASALASRLAAESNSNVSEWIVRSLSDNDDAQSVNALMSALDHPSADVREWAVRGLSGTRNERTIDALIAMLGDNNGDVREWAVRGLSGTRPERTVDALIAMLGDNNDDVREWSVRALGVCGNDRAVAPLQAMSQDPNEEVREWAGHALRLIDC